MGVLGWTRSLFWPDFVQNDVKPVQSSVEPELYQDLKTTDLSLSLRKPLSCGKRSG